TGLAAATSGVALMRPKESSAPRSFVNKIAGFAKFGWFRKLKNSARNCTSARSVSRNIFTTEKSQLRYPGARNVFRPPFSKHHAPSQFVGCRSTVEMSTGRAGSSAQFLTDLGL